jgi:hypothetical protein
MKAMLTCSLTFVYLFLKHLPSIPGVSPCSRDQRLLLQYLVELTLGDFSFSKYLPSQIAAAAVCLAMYTIFGTFTNKRQFEQYTEYSVQDLRPCIAELYAVHKRQWPQPNGSNHPLMALFNKFNRAERCQVASAVRPMAYFPEEL